MQIMELIFNRQLNGKIIGGERDISKWPQNAERSGALKIMPNGQKIEKKTKQIQTKTLA